MKRLAILLLAVTGAYGATPIRVFVGAVADGARDPELQACLVSELSKLDDIEIVKERPDFSLVVEALKSAKMVIASMLLTRHASGGPDFVKNFVKVGPRDADNLGKIFAMLAVTEVHTILVNDSVAETCSEVVRLADRIAFQHDRKDCADGDRALCMLGKYASPVTR